MSTTPARQMILELLAIDLDLNSARNCPAILKVLSQLRAFGEDKNSASVKLWKTRTEESRLLT